MSARPWLPSRAHVAGLLALAAAAGLLAVRTELAALPLAAFLVVVGAAPYFPGWSFFVPIVMHGPRSRPAVALTFDDGPDPRTLPRLLALLAEEGIRAAFFVVGRRAAAHPESIRAILAAGHELGNHSNTHDVLLATRSPARLRAEILGCEQALAPHGVRPLAYRPPVGITSPTLRPVLRELGLRCVAFSCRPLDFGSRRIADLAGRVLRRVRAGDIVLLHDHLPAATDVDTWLAEVRKILAGLREKGLRPVALSELLGTPVMATPRGPAPAPAAPSAGPGEGAPSGHAPALGRVLDGLGLVLAVGYPVLVALSVAFLGARLAALSLLGLLVLSRARTLRRDLQRARALTALAGSVGLLLVMGAILDDARFLLAYPSLVNAVLLAQFAWSLRGTPIAERFARLEVEALTAAEIRYCRRVTVAWCVFFVLNGGAATALAVAAPRAVWAAYTGGVSYALMGLLFAVEYVVRKARYGRFGRGLVDRILARALGRVEDAT
ncbi:MAG TPA: polysaccharide deacetylase family protein [Anaeromyxobacter sp.]|nr:polysaccharide deacetylase family protein [Anaeromyxobacter sp.]